MFYVSIAIVAIMVIFAIYGIIDYLFFRGKYGVGQEFKKGIELIGPLCLAIVGIIALVPVLARAIDKSITPVYQVLGLDPSMAVASILAIDMGGFQLAQAVAKNVDVGLWAGIVYGSMMGATVVFSIPVGLASILKKDIKPFSKGILFGVAAIPAGTLIGGLMIKINILVILKNLIIPIIFSILIILCITFLQNLTITIFKWFSIIVNIVCIFGLGLVMIKDLVLIPLSSTGIFDLKSVPFFNLLGSSTDGILVAGTVGLILSGALPFVYCLKKWFKTPLIKLSKITGFTESGITGFLLTAANNMAMFAIMEKMNEREKIVNTAFAVCAAFVIGDHLAFTAVNAPSIIIPMIIAKLVSGIIAILLALFFTSSKKQSLVKE